MCHQQQHNIKPLPTSQTTRPKDTDTWYWTDRYINPCATLQKTHHHFPHLPILSQTSSAFLYPNTITFLKIDSISVLLSPKPVLDSVTPTFQLTLCNDFTLTSPISHNFHSATPPTPPPANSPPHVFLSPYHHEQLIYLYYQLNVRLHTNPCLLATLSQPLPMHPCLWHHLQLTHLVWLCQLSPSTANTVKSLTALDLLDVSKRWCCE